MCEDCGFFRVGSDVDSCGSGVSVVSAGSSLALATFGTEMCPDEFWARESVEQGVCLSVRNPCSPFGVHHFSNVSVIVERETRSKMAAGFWQKARAGTGPRGQSSACFLVGTSPTCRAWSLTGPRRGSA